MPDKMDMHSLFGVSLLGGIGFTVSLFIATLSYTGMGTEGAILLNQAKIGIIGGSLFAGVCGYFYLKYALNNSLTFSNSYTLPFSVTLASKSST